MTPVRDHISNAYANTLAATQSHSFIIIGIHIFQEWKWMTRRAIIAIAGSDVPDAKSTTHSTKITIGPGMFGRGLWEAVQHPELLAVRVPHPNHTASKKRKQMYFDVKIDPLANFCNNDCGIVTYSNVRSREQSKSHLRQGASNTIGICLTPLSYATVRDFHGTAVTIHDPKPMLVWHGLSEPIRFSGETGKNNENKA